MKNDHLESAEGEIGNDGLTGVCGAFIGRRWGDGRYIEDKARSCDPSIGGGSGMAKRGDARVRIVSAVRVVARMVGTD